MTEINIEAASNAVVYINRDTKIVYANLNFMRLMGHERNVPLLGRFIHDALVVNPAETALMRAEPERPSATFLLELHPGDGTIPLRCIGEPAYDQEKAFIGWNLSFQAVQAAPEPAAEHAPENTSPDVDNSARLALEYALQQIAAIQTLLARLIGFGVRDRLETSLNTLAKEQGWPLSMVNGAFHIESDYVDPAVCQPLLSAAVSYGIQITGWQKISNEMLQVESKMDGEVLAAGDKLDLRRLIPTG